MWVAGKQKQKRVSDHISRDEGQNLEEGPLFYPLLPRQAAQVLGGALNADCRRSWVGSPSGPRYIPPSLADSIRSSWPQIFNSLLGVVADMADQYPSAILASLRGKNIVLGDLNRVLAGWPKEVNPCLDELRQDVDVWLEKYGILSSRAAE